MLQVVEEDSDFILSNSSGLLVLVLSKRGVALVRALEDLRTERLRLICCFSDTASAPSDVHQSCWEDHSIHCTAVPQSQANRCVVVVQRLDVGLSEYAGRLFAVLCGGNRNEGRKLRKSLRQGLSHVRLREKGAVVRWRGTVICRIWNNEYFEEQPWGVHCARVVLRHCSL